MHQGMEANWNRFKTLLERQWARAADALEILAGRRHRAPAEPTIDKPRVPPEHRE